MLYKGKDLQNVLIELLVFIVVDVVLLAVGLVAAYNVAFDVGETVGGIIVGVTFVVCIFIFGVFIAPCYHYYKYLLDVLTGKKTLRSGIIHSVGSKAVYKDNKNHYYEIDLEIGKELYALCLYDANLGKPDLKVGEHKTFLCFENYILKVQDGAEE